MRPAPQILPLSGATPHGLRKSRFPSGHVYPPLRPHNTDAPVSLYFFIIGIARFVLTFSYSTLFTLAAYRTTRNIRHLYLKAGLCQEVAYFDAGTGGSIAVQATSNGRLIQAGVSEKLGLVVQGLSAFVSAFVLAFVTQWKLTLITCCMAPATLIVMGVSSTIEASIETKVLKIQAQAGSFTESILSSARTVNAFGLRCRLVKDLDNYLQASRALGKKKNALFGCMFSAEYFIIFAGIGLCFWQGIRMIARGEVTEFGDVFMCVPLLPTLCRAGANYKPPTVFSCQLLLQLQA